MNTLHLTLKAQYYNMIEQGIKKEEYRDIKPYWCQRIQPCPCPNKAIYGSLDPAHHLGREYCLLDNNPCPVTFDVYCRHYDAVCFHYGYTKRTMTFKIEGINIGTGKPEWGAEQGKKYFVIKLGERLMCEAYEAGKQE